MDGLQFSLENIAVWEDIQKFKALSAKEELLKQATKIHALYLDNSAPLGLNTTSSLRNEVRDKIDKLDVTINLFNAIEKEAITNLYDTWVRFKDSESAAKYFKRLKEIEMEIGRGD